MSNKKTITQDDLKDIAKKLSGRDLFPEKTAQAKEYLKNAKLIEKKDEKNKG